jgi:hypothetical protein
MRPGVAPVILDHVHVGVRERRLAAAWYRRVSRLRIAYDYTRHGDPNGPLVLSGDNNKTHLALFVAKRKRTHIGTLAFRVAELARQEIRHVIAATPEHLATNYGAACHGKPFG